MKATPISKYANIASYQITPVSKVSLHIVYWEKLYQIEVWWIKIYYNIDNIKIKICQILICQKIKIWQISFYGIC